MLRITPCGPQGLRYARAVRPAEALEQIERSMGRIGRAGSSVMAARRRGGAGGGGGGGPGQRVPPAPGGVDMRGAVGRGGRQRVSPVARRAGMVAPLASRELRALERAGYV